MNIRIRQERPPDFGTIEALIIKAFKSATHSDGDEHNLVKRLRASASYIPELALVATCDGLIAGHILLTRIIIRSLDAKSHESLALAPLSVDPKFQGRGIGAALIEESHRIAKEQGHTSIVLLGHASYYPKFGYGMTSKFGIKAPFDVPEDAFMVLELKDGALHGVSGTVEYPAAFGIG